MDAGRVGVFVGCAMPEMPPSVPTFREALAVWTKIGLLSFGGPTGQIALMHQELVEKRRWVSEARFLHALNYCMLLPGPEAQQLSIYTGWLLHGVRGGLAAGTLFVLPGALLLWAVSWVYVVHGQVSWIAAIFAGLKPAVLGIVAFAVLRLGRKALRGPALWAVAAAAFAGIFFLKLPFPLLIAGAALAGFLGGRFFPRHFSAGGGGEHGTSTVIHDGPAETASPPPPLSRTLRTAGLWLAVWLAPVALAGLLLGRDHVLFAQGLFFSKAALVTFGGAYAVLPYVAQQAVETHGWLSAAQMLDGLALAETTPGPLILVLQYVGFLGAWAAPAPWPPLVAATLGAALTTWCTFVPGFLFIFAGAPYVEALRGQTLLNHVLTAITAAVVGVILNLAVWFGLGVVFPRDGTDWFAAGVTMLAFVGLQWFRWNVVYLVLACGLLGLLRHLL